MAAPVTVADVTGAIVRVPTLGRVDRNDECSECGGKLWIRKFVFASDCGAYCSQRCAVSHGTFLADELNRRRADDEGPR